MGQYRTRQDLVSEALANIGVLASGQTPSPEDYAFVDEKLESIVDGLAARDIVYVPDLANIPNQWFDPLAAIVADSCKAKFGISDSDAAVLVANNMKAETNLRVMNRGRPTFESLKALYF